MPTVQQAKALDTLKEKRYNTEEKGWLREWLGKEVK